MPDCEDPTTAKDWTPPPIGSPCWIEIPAVDVKACKKFYSELFPSWEFQPPTKLYSEEKMAMWKFSGPSGLGGGILQYAADCKTGEQKKGVGVTIYHFIDSIEAGQKRVEELGGKSISGKETEGDSGFYMNFLDVEGNRFGMYELAKK